MKHKLILTVALAILFSIFTVQTFASNPDFSGTWTLDTTKSEGLPPGMKQEMKVVQTDNKISIETKLMTDDGEQIVPDAYTLDGRESEFTPKPASDGSTGKGQRTAKWTSSGIEISDVSVYNTPAGDVSVKITRKWTLSTDGKTLQIEMNVESPQGTQTIKRIFTKK